MPKLPLRHICHKHQAHTRNTISRVFDACALIAYLNQEAGGESVERFTQASELDFYWIR